MLSSHRFIVASTCSVFTPNICVVFNTRYLIFNAKRSFVIYVLSLLARGHDHGSLASLRIKNTDTWSLCRIALIEAIDCWPEDCVTLRSFLSQCCVHTGYWITWWCTFSTYHHIKSWFCYMRLNIIRAWSRVLISNIEPAVLLSGCVWSKYSYFDTLRFCEGPILSDFGQTFANRRIVWIADVNVSAWSWVGCFDQLVAISLLLLLKSYLHSLFLK